MFWMIPRGARYLPIQESGLKDHKGIQKYIYIYIYIYICVYIYIYILVLVTWLRTSDKLWPSRLKAGSRKLACTPAPASCKSASTAVYMSFSKSHAIITMTMLESS